PDVDEQEDRDDRGFERDDEGAAQIPQRVAVQKVREHHHGDPAEQRAEGPDARTGEEPAEERDAEVRDAEETPEEARARDDALRGTECPSPGEDLFPPPAQFREQVPVQKEDDAEDEEEECDPEQADVIRRARSGTYAGLAGIARGPIGGDGGFAEGDGAADAAALSGVAGGSEAPPYRQ